jgi:carbon monoxide dehydrogenase subunit G
LDADRERVWRSLHDPDVLSRCIDGCERVTRLDDDSYDAVFTLKLGPIKAHFHVSIDVANVDPPARYRLAGSARIGAVETGHGHASVTMRDEGGRTRLAFVADLVLKGHLEKIGAGLIRKRGAAHIDEFFARFNEELSVE